MTASMYDEGLPKTAANFAALGYHPGFGMTATLPRIVGHQTAQWLFYTGKRLPGDFPWPG